MTQNTGRQNKKCSRQVNIFPTSLNFSTIANERKEQFITGCAPDFSLLNLPKGKSLGRSKPATSSYAQALLL